MNEFCQRRSFADGIGVFWDRCPGADGAASPDDVPVGEPSELQNQTREINSLLSYSYKPKQESNSLSPQRGASPTDPSGCIVLVPVGGHIEPGCEAGLQVLERRGYCVRRVRGYSAIDQARNQMASDALADGFEETMWIDSDIGFQADDVDRLRSHRLPIACGIYPKKGLCELACHVMPGTEHLLFGQEGSLVEILYAGAGFLLVHRDAYREIGSRLRLPLCNQHWGRPMVPYFQPIVKAHGDGHWYLAEDYAFCERARCCGLKVLADTRIRLSHYGTYGYSWEEGGIAPKRFSNFHYDLCGGEAATPEHRMHSDLTLATAGKD